MIDFDDCYVLGKNFHINRFKVLFNTRLHQEGGESEADFQNRVTAAEKTQESLEENLYIMPDGSILGIRKTVADRWLDDEDVSAVRWGRKKLPKELEIAAPDDLYKLLAAVVPLDETVKYE